MILALVGQPNCGKSTLFCAVAGYKTAIANFPGTTLEFPRSQLRWGTETFDIIEVPGLYSLGASTEEGRVARAPLLGLPLPASLREELPGADFHPDVIINVVDASLLSRSLELTLELIELGIPMVVGLNMMDEAVEKGIEIDVDHLARDLGVPVIPLVATLGKGIPELFNAVTTLSAGPRPKPGFPMSRDVEAVLLELEERLRLLELDDTPLARLPARWLATMLLENDSEVREILFTHHPTMQAELQRLEYSLEEPHGRPADVILGSERHALTLNLFEHVARVRSRRRKGAQDRLDAVVLHPLLGPLLLVGVLFGIFAFVFGLGRVAEQPLLALFDLVGALVASHMSPGTLALSLTQGLLQGFTGGVAIVLPYLLPFLVGLALLEDVGYLPRAAFLMDSLMHRIGLHGKAIIPFVLGYGCTVPAILATRTLENRRDRFVSAVLVNLIPCAARTTIVFALVGFFLGPWKALGCYILNLLVIALVGRLLLRVQGKETPGLVLEIPPYRTPNPRQVARKVWFRMREFIVMAWPILIAGSLVLSLLGHFKLDGAVNQALSPLTVFVLGLPEQTGISLVFGILRKELTIVMLVQALGTADFAAVLSEAQMAVFTTFSLFYVPCLATLATLRSVLGLKGMAFTMLLTTVVATVLSVAVRLVFAIFA